MAQVKVGPPLADAKAKRDAAMAARDYLVGLIRNAKSLIVDPLPGGDYAIVSLSADGKDFVETPAVGPDTMVDDGLTPDPAPIVPPPSGQNLDPNLTPPGSNG